MSSRGHRLGSLCVFDLTPRTLSTDALNLLASLAEMAARLLEESQVGGREGRGWEGEGEGPACAEALAGR